MKFSPRVSVVALLAVAGVAGGAQVASATAMTPEQAGAAEAAAAGTRVPFDVPLGSGLAPLTGATTSTAVQGSLPGLPVQSPAQGARDEHALLPQPLVPALQAADQTPDLHLLAPALAGNGSVKPNGVDVSLPKAPLKAVGSAASLGSPLTWSGSVPKPGTVPADTPREQLDLTKLQPQLTSPQLVSDPEAFLSLDQRATQRPMGRTVGDFLATAKATAQELSNG
ncbi:hypothetical protein [Streptacidiphilus carbonis]|uniref:hypothetical protein n=1 Tax=Streptacidiphilus carbonis TaxID=105422 RepID=UPI001269DFA8|nr:hypothetical protein [Streptacidiphilus carbonis]